MVSFIIAESAIFTIFVVAYLFYVGKSLTGPTPRDVLEVPIFYTICLLSSSVTIHLAGRRLERNESRAFGVLWLITIALGAIFMFGTAEEWRRLIYEHGLTISTNLFGTTYYSLVGLHAFHVTLGLVHAHDRVRGGRCRRCAYTVQANRRAVALLALRRRGVDCRLHRRVRHRALSRSHGH